MRGRKLKQLSHTARGRGGYLNRVVRKGLHEMSELRPEHLNMPAWEVSAVSKKDMFSHEPKAPWLHLGEDGSVKERAPRDIASGVEGRSPRASVSVFLHSFAAI